MKMGKQTQRTRYWKPQTARSLVLKGERVQSRRCCDSGDYPSSNRWQKKPNTYQKIARHQIFWRSLKRIETMDRGHKVIGCQKRCKYPTSFYLFPYTHIPIRARSCVNRLTSRQRKSICFLFPCLEKNLMMMYSTVLHLQPCRESATTHKQLHRRPQQQQK